MATALYNIFIMPLELFIELVFSVTNTIFNNPGFAIIFVSIAVQLLCFPLYKRADDIQTEDREKQKEMKPWLDHIKKTFKGDERFMMQQTYYRSVNYKPIYAVKGSISLLLQIPFFIAAYNFLSNLELLKKVSFLGIADLSQPDQLIHIGGITLNLLPVLMTFFNVISGIIYLRGLPLKDKIQTYGLAALFLVILYKSPSGLVFYWTLNNLFSLLKNVFLKLVKNPRKIIRVFMLALGIIVPVYVIFFSGRAIYLKLASIAFSLICLMPTVVHFIKKKSGMKASLLKNIDVKLSNTVFYLSLTVIFILCALVIPAYVIKASPIEFISVSYGPIGLLFRVMCIFAGLLFVWVNIFYVFASEKAKKIFSLVISAATVVFAVDYFFFARKLGLISPYLIYDKYPVFSLKDITVNILVILLIALTMFFAHIKKAVIIKRLYQIAALSFAVTFIFGLVQIEKTLAFEGHPEKNKAVDSSSAEDEKIIELSKNNKNVIVFMLDRAIGGYIPYIMEEKPELKEMFDGFTYYPNTMSFGGGTNLGTPALFGGYEYTPELINKKKEVSLKDKQNEALSVMPVTFMNNGFDVTVLDPPYAGYRWVPDLSIYDKYENIKAYNLKGKYASQTKQQYSSMYESTQIRSFVFYSLMKSLPVVTQNILYDSGEYWSSAPSVDSISYFLDSYTVLERLSKITKTENTDKCSFIMMQNSTTHDPIILEEPDYIPTKNAVIPSYNQKTLSDGSVLRLDNENGIKHFQSNICALLRVGEWLEYLKSNGVYDNTRIIIVSDHGWNLNQFQKMELNNGIDVESYNPLLMVKDFNATGFTTSDEFMTNADTPALAFSGVVSNPLNPFTGKALNNSEKFLHGQVLTTSSNVDITKNNGNTFDTSDGEWWSVKDNIFDVNNWQKVEVN